MSSPPGAFSWFPPTLTVDDEHFVVSAQGCFVVFRYLTGRGSGRPHLATLCGPSGRNLLEDSPVDHLHHRGVWWGHGDVNGVDFYLELPGGDGPLARGGIEHVEWRRVIDDAPRFGFIEAVAWCGPGGAVVLCEERSVLLHLAGPDHYTVDLASTYTAQVDVVFGDTKEAALPGIRVAEVLTAAGGGTIRNSAGHTGEQDTFGQPADWVDVSGERTLMYLGGRQVEGLACFDHPANPGHPNQWFTRGYGPFSPFPGHQFFDQRTLAAGATFRRCHRLVVHQGDAEEAGLDDRYRAYRSLAPFAPFAPVAPLAPFAPLAPSAPVAPLAPLAPLA